MRSKGSIAFLVGILLLGLFSSRSQAASNPNSEVVITFSDGHQQRFPVSDISGIEFKGSSMIVSRMGRSQSFAVPEIARIEFTAPEISTFGRGRYIGKWKVGDGSGSNFFITLNRNGEAHRSLNSNRGTWTVVNGEARITWDDGWHDAIRKIGARYEKVAFKPGRTFDETPSNVANAENTNPEPL